MRLAFTRVLSIYENEEVEEQKKLCGEKALDQRISEHPFKGIPVHAMLQGAADSSDQTHVNQIVNLNIEFPQYPNNSILNNRAIFPMCLWAERCSY